jgi:hypothetical protein
MINFPCPKKIEEFKRVEGGFYCGDCNEQLLDLTDCSTEEIQQAKQDFPNACVVMNEEQASVNTYGFKRFALALIIVMGTSGFVFSNDHIKTNIEEVRSSYLPAHDTLNNIQVTVTNKQGEARYAWVRVVCENDSVYNMQWDEMFNFSMHLGEEFEGQKVIIEVFPSKGRKKRKVIDAYDPQEFYYFNFSYHRRKFYRRITGKF